MNPYQYAYNNPLRYVDRSGNIVISALQWAQIGMDPTEGMYNPSDMLIEDVLGGLGGAVGYGLERLVKSLLAAKALRAAGGSVDDIIEGGITGRLKPGPKPQGTGLHNKKIAEITAQVTDGKIIAGGQKLPEKLIQTPNGIKTGRRADILVERFEDATIYGINVGKTTGSGALIKREIEAIYDLEDAGIEMFFVKYQ